MEEELLPRTLAEAPASPSLLSWLPQKGWVGVSLPGAQWGGKGLGVLGRGAEELLGSGGTGVPQAGCAGNAWHGDGDPGHWSRCLFQDPACSGAASPIDLLSAL